MNTRGLTGLASSRVADVTVTVVYNVLAPDENGDDGSDVVTPFYEYPRGSIVALQPKDIQRLQEGGITVNNGISLLLRSAREDRPDKISVNNKLWRVVTWSFTYEYTEENGGSGSTARGTVVAVCDEILTGAAL